MSCTALPASEGRPRTRKRARGIVWAGRDAVPILCYLLLALIALAALAAASACGAEWRMPGEGPPAVPPPPVPKPPNPPVPELPKPPRVDPPPIPQPPPEPRLPELKHPPGLAPPEPAHRGTPKPGTALETVVITEGAVLMADTQVVDTVPKGSRFGVLGRQGDLVEVQRCVGKNLRRGTFYDQHVRVLKDRDVDLAAEALAMAKDLNAELDVVTCKARLDALLADLAAAAGGAQDPRARARAIVAQLLERAGFSCDATPRSIHGTLEHKKGDSFSLSLLVLLGARKANLRLRLVTTPDFCLLRYEDDGGYIDIAPAGGGAVYDTDDDLWKQLGGGGARRAGGIRFESLPDPRALGVLDRAWGDALLAAGRHADALAKYALAAQINPEDPDVYLRWADALDRAGKAEEACEKYALAAACAPYDSVAYADWAAALLRMGRAAEACEKCSKATRIDPHLSAAYLTWATALRRLGRNAEAVEKLARVAGKDAAAAPPPKAQPAAPPPPADVAQKSAGPKPPKPPTPAAQPQPAPKAAKTPPPEPRPDGPKPDRGGETAEVVSPQALVMDARVLVARGRRFGVLRRGPDSVKIQIYANGKLLPGRLAAQDVRLVEEGDPNLFSAVHEMIASGPPGTGAESPGVLFADLTKRLADVRALPNPRISAVAHFLRARRMAHEGRVEDAAAAYAAAVEVHPEYAEAYCLWGSLLVTAKRYAEACERFAKAAELQADCVQAYRAEWDRARGGGDESQTATGPLARSEKGKEPSATRQGAPPQSEAAMQATQAAMERRAAVEAFLKTYPLAGPAKSDTAPATPQDQPPRQAPDMDRLSHRRALEPTDPLSAPVLMPAFALLGFLAIGLMLARRRIRLCPDCKERAHFLRPCWNCGMPAPGLRQCATIAGVILVVALIVALVASLSYVLDDVGDGDRTESDLREHLLPPVETGTANPRLVLAK